MLKWFWPDGMGEADADRALAILDQVRTRRLPLLQPPHWLAEVAAVAVRFRPQAAEAFLWALHGLRVPVESDMRLVDAACRLSAELRHHLFDTLYHAVALQHPGYVFITADEAYYRKAKHLGAIMRLADFPA